MSIVPGRDVPEVPQAWVDAVNKAVNDANHEDLCSSLHTLAECDSYKPGQWDIGVDLDIAVGALEPLIRERIGRPPDALAESLAATVQGIDAHIERRAQEIAEPRVASAQRHAEFLINGDREEREAERQRKDDLIKELRRQLDAAGRSADRSFTELKELRALRERVVQRLYVQATGPDGERWASYDALVGAIWPEKETEASK